MAKKIIIALVVVAVAVFAFFFFKKTPTVRAPAEEKVNQTPPVQNEVKEEAKTEPTSTPPATEEPKPIDLSQYKTPIMLVDQKKSYTAKMKTTAGEMDIELNVKDTPITANIFFVFLAKKNFYDNVIFHRIIKGFMI